jgi:membrane protease YdiL (CAAX protease family)
MLNFTKEISRDFLAFLKNPAEKADAVQTRSEKAKKLFTLLMIDIPVMGVLICVLSGIQALGLFDLHNNKFNQLFLTIPVWPLTFILVILIPFFEELIFRLYLRYKYNYLLRFLVSTTSVAGEVNHEKAGNWAKQFWIRRYNVIFYFSAILFGFYHLANYKISPMILLFSPIIVAPQIIAGLFFGYLRVRHDLLLGFSMHGLHNVIFAFIPLLYQSSASNICIDTKECTMEIVKSNNLPVISYISFYHDSVIINEASVKYILAEVLNKDYMLIKSNDELFMNTKINLKYKNKHINHSQNQKDIDYPLLRKNLLNELTKAFGFRIKNELIKQEDWDLCMVDSTLLAKYVSDSIKSNRIDVLAGEISSSNTSMWHLSKALSQACNKRIVDKTGTKKKYAIELQTDDFEALQKQLRAEYGLSLKKSEKEIEYTTIEF